MRIIVATLQEPHAPARSVRADISITTSALLDRCLHKDPEDRFADGAALLAALQECLGALAAPPEKQQEIVARWNSCLPVPPQKTETFQTPAPKKPGSSTKITLLDSAVVVLKRGAERLAYWRAMSRGQSLLKKAKWTQAEESFRAALIAIPGDKKAEDGDSEAALNGASDTRFEMAFAEAEEAAKSNDWELARVAYQRALSERPQHARAISGRGLALYQKAMLSVQSELMQELVPERGHYPELEHGRRNRVEVALAEALKALPGDKAATELLEQIGDPARAMSLDLGGGITLPLVRVKHESRLRWAAPRAGSSNVPRERCGLNAHSISHARRSPSSSTAASSPVPATKPPLKSPGRAWASADTGRVGIDSRFELEKPRLRADRGSSRRAALLV